MELKEGDLISQGYEKKRKRLLEEVEKGKYIIIRSLENNSPH